MVKNSNNSDSSNYVSDWSKRSNHSGRNKNKENISNGGLNNYLYGNNSGNAADRYASGMGNMGKNNNQENDLQSQDQENSNKSSEASELPRKKSLARRLVNKLSGNKKNLQDKPKVSEKVSRLANFAMYRSTGSPEAIGETLGLSMLVWWTIHGVAKYIGGFQSFPKFVSLSKPEIINKMEIEENRETTSIPMVISYFAVLTLWLLVSCIVVIFIGLVVNAGNTKIWDVVIDPIGTMKELQPISDLIRAIITK